MTKPKNPKLPGYQTLNKWIIAVGNPGEGFVFIGPFDTFEEALEYAEANLRRSAWSISELVRP